MAKTTIVDATKTENPAAGGTMGVTVPLKMDASALAKAIQAAASQQPQTVRVNPSELIKDAAARMEDLYTRFNALRQIGTELHGKSLSDPIPQTLKIEDISITFRSVKDGKESEPTVAHVKNVVCVGDISNLLSSELGTIILALQQEAAAVKETATTAEETCTKARQTWEANNPDRKIVSRGSDVSTLTVADGPAPAAPAGPVTLQGSDETPTV
ncbi:hypothetical protein EBZ80_22125 [bacterium]|nr:hypothetical protein [Betaproteobacteria bacterium]NDE17623.1 hypothetical protein [bacterium]